MLKKIDSLEAQIQQMQETQRQLRNAISDQAAATAASKAAEVEALERKSASDQATQAAAEAKAAAVQAEVAKNKAEAAQNKVETTEKTAFTGDIPGSFKVPGTNTSVKIGGAVKIDVADDLSNSLGGSATDWNCIGFKGSSTSHRGGQVQFTARQSKLSLETSTPSEIVGPIKAFFEGDFYGGGGAYQGTVVGPDRKNTNSAYFRIRQAYLEASNVLIGQTWSTFMDLPSSPETLDVGGPPGVNNGIRQPLVRYSTNLGSGRLHVALESPDGDFQGANQAQFTSGASATSSNNIDVAPDVVLKYEYKPSWGQLTTSAVGRWQTASAGGGTVVGTFNGRADAPGYGVLLGGLLRPVEGHKSGLHFQVLGGNGIGRYLAPTTSTNYEYGAVVDQKNRSLESLFAWGSGVGTKIYWADQWRSTFVVSHAHVSNYHSLLPAAALKNLDAFVANILWSPFANPATYIGLEYTFAHVENYSIPTATLSNKGDANRIMGSVQYAF
ncbi:DcaP family trimeric outer membrane transporter [Telmatospirillum sp.]|uniref:DcaP family trimeric outer membrane transporter n=1 Tax=Telmatospirillum sp. TaxID=2079197 RepID=UPI00283ACCEF|nr:DcaP family trimeric outer membrane transporter [Telmatospirillum sp.]MDR3435477.1 DcaP family trimeric outer membrane transporter [Telmatospirillum sp.]